MTHRARLALILGPTLLLCACAPGMLASIFGIASAAAPAVTSVLDAYAANARAIAPNASEPDLRVLAALLEKRDRCTVAASAVLMTDAGTPLDAMAAALAADEKAVRELADAVRALTAANGAGKDGGA
jgi:poly-gamma-glutamate capsule biosynthesis protein CapA/YwtB (metallophosphatase superfamily)